MLGEVWRPLDKVQHELGYKRLNTHLPIRSIKTKQKKTKTKKTSNYYEYNT